MTKGVLSLFTGSCKRVCADLSLCSKYGIISGLTLLVSFASSSPAADIAIEAQRKEPPSPAEAIRDPSQPPRAAPLSARDDWAPLGLPRLRANNRGSASRLSGEKFHVDSLNTSNDSGSRTGQSVIERDGLKVLKILSGNVWSRDMRSAASSTLFVSFRLYASVGTKFEIGGVTFRVDESPINGAASLVRLEQVRDEIIAAPLGIHVAWNVFDGHKLAGLPVLTVRYDHNAGVWDLFSSTSLVADNLLIQKESAGYTKRQITLTGGASGAWLVGLVQSEENPLFEDTNGSGIEDGFQRIALNGALLSKESTWLERRRLASAWRKSDRDKPRPALLVEPLRPDSFKGSGR